MAVFLIVLAALSAAAYTFFARSTHETLEPLLALPEGQAAYAAAMRRIAGTIALLDLPLAIVVGLAAYILARVSVEPLVAARTREERFAADAAHELRTPLATIAAIAQANRDASAERQREALEKITSVAIEASTLLGDLMALMRDAPNQQRLDEPVDIGTLVTRAAYDARVSAGTVHIDVHPPADAAYAIGDERALAQLLRKLIENGIRHARSRVDVGVRTERGAIVVWVEDDGPGVAPADRERVFDRFYKADANSPGSGLGLAIARHIAARHGGTLVVEDRARFVARFPAAPSEPFSDGPPEAR